MFRGLSYGRDGWNYCEKHNSISPFHGSLTKDDSCHLYLTPQRWHLGVLIPSNQRRGQRGTVATPPECDFRVLPMFQDGCSHLPTLTKTPTESTPQTKKFEQPRLQLGNREMRCSFGNLQFIMTVREVDV